MKQEIISYLSTIQGDIYNLSKYLYENPEASFKEQKACKYITDMLSENNFQVTLNYMDIPTAFCAQAGHGHPKICYVCEYDAVEGEGHITGHNLISSMSIAAALGLSQVIPKIGGSVIVLGCPGEFLDGSKVTMIKQGAFNDIDAVLMAHPDVITAESGTSMALLPLCIKFKSPGGLAYRNIGKYSALDACVMTYNCMSFLSKGLNDGCTVNAVITNGGNDPHLIPDETELKAFIRSSNMQEVEKVEKKLRQLIAAVSDLMGVEHNICLCGLPYEELITNRTLSRIFSHNLKEAGIIDVGDPRDKSYGLSLGNVSHKVPCIHPYVSITENDDILYSSKDFAHATISSHAHDKVMKGAQSLALTGLDLIESETLLSEVKSEFYGNEKRD